MAEKVDQMDPDEKIVEIAIERLRVSKVSCNLHTWNLGSS